MNIDKPVLSSIFNNNKMKYKKVMYIKIGLTPHQLNLLNIIDKIQRTSLKKDRLDRIQNVAQIKIEDGYIQIGILPSKSIKILYEELIKFSSIKVPIDFNEDKIL